MAVRQNCHPLRRLFSSSRLPDYLICRVDDASKFLIWIEQLELSRAVFEIVSAGESVNYSLATPFIGPLGTHNIGDGSGDI